jgi:hypothetical protein
VNFDNDAPRKPVPYTGRHRVLSRLRAGRAWRRGAEEPSRTEVNERDPRTDGVEAVLMAPQNTTNEASAARSGRQATCTDRLARPIQ